MSHEHGRLGGISLIVVETSPSPMGTARIHSPGELYHWYQRISCYVLCLIWSTRWYRCGFIMTVTGSHVDQKWRRGRFVKVNVRINVRQWMKQPPDLFKCPLPSQHMASDIQHVFHTRIPDYVWTLQNVRIIKLMAINEGGGGWQGYKPPISLVISSPDAWSCAALLSGHITRTMFCPHLFPGLRSPHFSNIFLFLLLSPGNPHCR